MNHTIPFETQSRESAEFENDGSTEGNRREKPHAPRLIACLILLPEDSEPIFSLLEKLAVRECDLPSDGRQPNTNRPAQSTREDSWLQHSEAAVYLGVSKSTLYHYSCQEQIERRKLGGRLEYRRSALDTFKQDHTLPASCRSTSTRIMASAHSSGK